MNKNKMIAVLCGFVCSFSAYSKTYPALENKNVLSFIEEFSEKSKYTKSELEYFFGAMEIKEKISKSSKKKNQAEFKLNWDTYKNRVVSENRIKNGKLFIEKNFELLEKVEKKYGVEKHIIAAIIGIESNYGENKGDHIALEAMATMAFENHPRSKFFRKQIESFLHYCYSDKITCMNTKSSWAGALGYGQFIPTSIDSFGVDFNNDGKVDPINSIEDATASVANYLYRHGWKKNDFIAKKVEVSDSRYKKVLSNKLSLNNTVEDFRYLGISNIGNIRGSKKAKLFELKSDHKSEVWIGFKNFKAITHYNKSNYYATSVFLLSESIKK